MTATEGPGPVRHWLIEDAAPPSLVAACHDSTPPSWWGGWEARYDNDCERGKRTARDRHGLAPCWAELLGWLDGPLLARTRLLLGMGEELAADPTLHGAGVHVTDPGGHLSPHLDYSRHADGRERRANCVLFLTPDWRPEWGGALEFYAPDGRTVLASYLPAAGRAVVWESSEVAYHGVTRLASDARPRVTAAAYYLAPPRPGCVRTRALFCPNRG